MSYWYNSIYPENKYFYDQNRYQYINHEGNQYCSCRKKPFKPYQNPPNQLKSSQWYCCKEEDLKKYSDYHFKTPSGTYYKIKPMKYTANRDAVTQCNFPLLDLNILNQSDEKKKRKHQNKLLKRNKTCPQLQYDSKSFLMSSTTKIDRLKIEQTQNVGCDCRLSPSNGLKSKSSCKSASLATKSRPASAGLKQKSLERDLKDEESNISNFIISRGSSKLNYSCNSLNCGDDDIKMLKPPSLGQMSRSTITDIHSEDLEMEGEDYECNKVKSCHLLERIRNAYRKRYKKE